MRDLRKIQENGKNPAVLSDPGRSSRRDIRKITKTAEDQEKWVHYRNKSALLLGKEQKNTIDVLILETALAILPFPPCRCGMNTGSLAFVGGQSGQNIQESYIAEESF